MPLAKIHVVEGRYDEIRIAKVSGAIQAALINTLRVPPEDFYQLIFELPKNRLLHTPSFVGMHYTDDLIILDLGFIQGRPKETRLALLKDINTRVTAAAGVSPDDMLITLYEVPGKNISFGQGEAQRANAVARARGYVCCRHMQIVPRMRGSLRIHVHSMRRTPCSATKPSATTFSCRPAAY